MTTEEKAIIPILLHPEKLIYKKSKHRNKKISKRKKKGARKRRQQMKTLVNKRNPAIKIIADTLLSDSFNYITSFCSVPKSDWTLVEEEFPKIISDEKMEQMREEISKTAVANIRGQFNKIVETEPVNLEKDIEMEWDSFDKHVAEYGEKSEDVVWLNWPSFVDVTTYFYELGLKRKEE